MNLSKKEKFEAVQSHFAKNALPNDLLEIVNWTMTNTVIPVTDVDILVESLYEHIVQNDTKLWLFARPKPFDDLRIFNAKRKLEKLARKEVRKYFKSIGIERMDKEETESFALKYYGLQKERYSNLLVALYFCLEDDGEVPPTTQKRKM